MASGDHVINNKKVDPKKAKARYGKIFVGGLSNEISDEDIKSYFAQYGNVSSCSDHIQKTIFAVCILTSLRCVVDCRS